MTESRWSISIGTGRALILACLALSLSAPVFAAAAPARTPSPAASTAPDPLNGTGWATGCVDHVRRQLQFFRDELTYIVDVYADESCRERLGTLMRIGGYVVRDVEARDGVLPGKGSWPLDFTLRAMSWTPHSLRFVDALVTVHECGIRDWKVGESRAFLGVLELCYFLEAAGPWAGEPQLAPSKEDLLQEWVEVEPGELRISEGFGTRRHRDARTRDLLPAVFKRE